jgi:hypothetical protein
MPDLNNVYLIERVTGNVEIQCAARMGTDILFFNSQ